MSTQREIKHAFWHEQRKMWIDAESIGISGNGRVTVWHEGTFEPEIDPPGTLVQFTGLMHDGMTWIWEGGIFRVKWTEELGVTELDCDCVMEVRWDDESAAFKLFPLKPYRRSVDYGGEESGVFEVSSLPLSQVAIIDDEYSLTLEYLGSRQEHPSLLNT